MSAACVADLWAQYRAVGAQELVITGQVQQAEDIERYRAALGETPLLVCRLRASRERLRDRILDRTRGNGPLLAGDALVNLSAHDVGPMLQRTLAEQNRLEQVEIADVVLDTDGLEPELAAQRLAGWLDRNSDDAHAH